MAQAACVRYLDRAPDASGPRTDAVSSLEVGSRSDQTIGEDQASPSDQAMEKDEASPSDQAMEKDEASPADQTAEKDQTPLPDLGGTCGNFSSWTCLPSNKLDAGTTLQCHATCGGNTIACSASRACFCNYSTSCGIITGGSGCMVCSSAFNSGCCP